MRMYEDILCEILISFFWIHFYIPSSFLRAYLFNLHCISLLPFLLDLGSFSLLSVNHSSMFWLNTNRQLSTHHHSHSSSSKGPAEKIQYKSSWAEVRTGSSLTKYCHRQKRHSLQKINLLPITTRLEQ